MSGSRHGFTSGSSARVDSGSRHKLRGSVVDNEDEDLDLPPTFDNVSCVAGESVLNLYCDTDRDAVIQVRCVRVVGGETTGPFYYSLFEPVARSAGHGRQIEGLAAGQTWLVQVQIIPVVGPRLVWVDFDDGVTGPDFSTGPKGTEDPPPPAEE